MDYSSILKRSLPLVFMGLFGCSSGLKLTSEWRTGEIQIDGSDAEWQRGLYYDEETEMLYSVRNDDESLYLLLKTQNRSTQTQILRGGFTVWFDPSGGKARTFGLHYPLPREHTPLAAPEENFESPMAEGLDQTPLELEIIGPQSDNVQRMPVFDARGISVKTARTRGTIVYELCIPLKKNALHPYAIDMIPGKRIGIGLTTEEFKHTSQKKRASSEDGGEMGVGLPGEEGGMEGHGRGRNGPHSSGPRLGTQLKMMNLWLSVQLSPTPGGK
jgi:hypothetical protein